MNHSLLPFKPHNIKADIKRVLSDDIDFASLSSSGWPFQIVKKMLTVFFGSK